MGQSVENRSVTDSAFDQGGGQIADSREPDGQPRDVQGRIELCDLPGQNGDQGPEQHGKQGEEDAGGSCSSDPAAQDYKNAEN